MSMDIKNLEQYREKEYSAEDLLLKFVNPGDTIILGSGCAEPIELTKKLIEIGQQLPDVEILHFLSLSDLDYYKKAGGEEDLFRHDAYFIGESLRDAVQKGQADYTPILLSEIPDIFKSGKKHLDCALIQVSPPDEEGLCTFGINVDIMKAVTKSAKCVVAEINPNMPKTHGDSDISMDDIDGFITTDHEIIEFEYKEITAEGKKIGEYVASLIEDGSTIQMGIGKIPNAITKELTLKKDLGVHSEVFSDGVVDLVERGVITGKEKTLHRGKIVCSFVIGTKRLYDFVDNNPMVEFYPSDYVNDTSVIKQNKKQVAINAAISVDITGQVNADSVGPRFYSGIGGQVDFVRGAAKSKGGRPIMVLPSTAKLKNGKTVSRIVPYLQPGSGVVITRGDVHYVVTEWGIADLYGKNVRERVLQMINIAHPDFRNDLLQYAKKWNYVYSDQMLPKSVEGRISIYPEKYEKTLELENEKMILIRPVKPTDERMIQELHYSLDPQDRYYRFFTHVKRFPHKRMQPLVNINYATEMILVAEYSEGDNKEIIAMGGYFQEEQPTRAEIAMAVHKEWRGLGIATFLLDYLVEIGREQNYKTFTGEMLFDNKKMIHIIKSSKYPIEITRTEMNVMAFEMNIKKKAEKDLD